MCVCVTVKYNLTIIVLVSTQSYSPSAQLLCSLARLGPLFQNSGSAPAYSIIFSVCSTVVLVYVSVLEQRKRKLNLIKFNLKKKIKYDLNKQNYK